MPIDAVWRSINAAYDEWADHLGNPNFCRQGNSLTWQGRQRIWLRNEFDRSAYLQLAEARQYSFVVAEDGGLIQLHYEFDGDELKAASAGYYGSSQITLIGQEPSMADGIEETSAEIHAAGGEVQADGQGDEIDETDEPPAVVPEGEPVYAEIVELIPSIRLDYSPSSFRPFVHESAHLHIPSFAQSRIPVSGFPSPQQFIELVFAWFYPSIYESKYEGFAGIIDPQAASIDHAVISPQYIRSRLDLFRDATIHHLQVSQPYHLPVLTI